MTASTPQDFVFLVATDRPSLVPRLERVLRDAGVSVESGLAPGSPPHVVFLVPRSDLAAARDLLRAHRYGQDLMFDDDVVDDAVADKRDQPIPWGAVQAVSAVVLLHLGLVFALVGRNPSAVHLAGLGALVSGRVQAEPWRLVTSLFVHANPSHALWNGVSMLVFAVPLITSLGYARSAAVYFVAGLFGGLASLWASMTGDVIVGSSGAVAGLFGAWIAMTLAKARGSGLPRRARIRAFGLALLVLPALLSPTTSSGHAVSVEAHLGGLAAGLVAGTVMAWRTGPARPRVGTEGESETT